jgi:glycosyltransferase involved in cell wall biosynthesis
MLPTLVLFTPLSPQRTGLTEHIETLLPHLAPHFGIRVVTCDSYRPSRRVLAACTSLGVTQQSYAEFRRDPGQYDIIVYQLGNDAHANGYMYEALHQYPGIVLLHDLTLYHGILHSSLMRGRPSDFVAEMHYALGYQGRRLAENTLQGRAEETAECLLAERVLDDALALVGFNSYVVESATRLSPGLKATWVPLHTACPAGFPQRFDPVRFRRSLGLEHTPLVATVGLYNPNNRIGLVLQAFKRLLDDCPDAVYLLVGQPPNQAALEQEIVALGLEGKVRFTGWVSAIEFEQYLRIPDVAVQLRYPHAGGTSYNPIRLAAAGVPTIISRIPPMRDIPEEVMPAIEAEAPDEVEQVHSALRRLLTDPSAREELGKRAQEYAQAHHAPEIAARGMVSFLRDCLAERDALLAQQEKRYCPRAMALGLQGLLVQHTGAALTGLGLAETTPEWLGGIAQEIVAFSAMPQAGMDA